MVMGISDRCLNGTKSYQIQFRLVTLLEEASLQAKGIFSMLVKWTSLPNLTSPKDRLPLLGLMLLRLLCFEKLLVWRCCRCRRISEWQRAMKLLLHIISKWKALDNCWRL